MNSPCRIPSRFPSRVPTRVLPQVLPSVLPRHLLRVLLRVLAAVLLLVTASCGSAGTIGNDGTTNASIALTDAPSDDVELFEVDVKNIVLTRLDDSTISVMSRRARVDFAQLATLSELLVGFAVPIGVYKSMSICLDFVNAQVFLRDKTTTATILDASGAAITGDVNVTVTFASTSRPRTVIGRNHLFLFDLDLNQSLAVDLAKNSVTFSPVATAEFDPKSPKPVFLTGTLQSVDVASSTVTVARRTGLGVVIGTYAVATTTTTVFQINGRNYQGSTAMATLANVATNSRIFVQGTLSPTSRRLTAIAIETGTGTPGNGQDYVVGHVVARDNGSGTNATLTVLGMSVDVSNSTRRFNTSHTVSVALATTKVLKRLSDTGVTTDALNVGQRIIAFGNATGTALDATGADGIVRMRRTSIWGTAVATPSTGTLTLNVNRIGLRPVGSFNFTVGGTPQATPTAYTIATGTLSTAGITTGTKIRALGFVNGVDIGNDKNMTATALVNHSTTGTLLLCQWVPANTTAISSATSTAVTLDVTNAAIKTVSDGFGTTTLTNSPTPPRIKPRLGVGFYRIIQGGAIELHLSFDTFATALTNRIGAGAKVFRVTALGTADPATQTLEALAVAVILQ